MTEIQRDRYGRPLVVPLEGGKAVAYTRVTTLAKALSDTAALARWQCRQVALGMSRSPDLVALASSADPRDRDALNDIIDRASERAGSTSAANTGTATHAALQALVEGRPTAHMPEGIVRDAQAALGALARVGLTPVASEMFMVCDELHAAGTLDMLAAGTKGGRFIVDLKTSSETAPKYAAVEWALQLAVYSHGTPYDPETGRRPWPDDLTPDLATGVIVHVPAGTASAAIHRLDLAEGWQLAHLAADVRRARRAHVLDTLGGAA